MDEQDRAEFLRHLQDQVFMADWLELMDGE